MANFLLIHGAWHGAWCWADTLAALKAAGHDARSIDLPGHGADATPPAEVTLDDYVSRIGEALAGFDGKVILVGHSMGGMVVSAAAEAYADRLAKVVYLCAFLPRDGESLMDLEGRNPRPTVPPALLPDPEGKTAMLQPDKLVPLFFHDCTPGQQRMAVAKLTPQTLEPLGRKLTLTPARFGQVPKAYIECTDDRAISIELQRDMIAASGVTEVLSMPTSHSPFLAAPTELAEKLASLA